MLFFVFCDIEIHEFSQHQGRRWEIVGHFVGFFQLDEVDDVKEEDDAENLWISLIEAVMALSLFRRAHICTSSQSQPWKGAQYVIHSIDFAVIGTVLASKLERNVFAMNGASGK